METRYGVRVLTADQLAGLSDHGFKSYRTKVLAKQAIARRVVYEFCCSECSEVVSEREPTQSEAEEIRHFDMLASRVADERRRRSRESLTL